MSLGAYFGSTRITQGAGGLGQDGPLMAYADGVVGGNPDESTPGQLFAYHDGSLGLGQDGPLHGVRGRRRRRRGGEPGHAGTAVRVP